METYTVKQIADLVKTNPETVRRWIRDGKIKAVQVSRKDGNIIAESELLRFLKATPKYQIALTTVEPKSSPPFEIAALAGSILTGAIIGYLNEKRDTEIGILPDDFKDYLQSSIGNLMGIITQKVDLIRQTENEIAELKNRVNHLQYLLEHDDILKNTICSVMPNQTIETE